METNPRQLSRMTGPRGRDHLRHLSAWLMLTLLLAIIGCSLESPEAPSYSITFNLPFAESVTGLQIADSLDSVEGDSTTAGPLRVEFDGHMDRVMVSDRLGLDIAEQTHRVELEDIDFTPPDIDPVTLEIAELWPGSLPPVGTPVAVDPFSFTTDMIDLGTYAEFVEVSFTRATLLLTVTNNLGIPIGGTDVGQEVTITLEDLSTVPRQVVAVTTIMQEVLPGADVPLVFDLSGKTVGNHLGCWLSGWSPGGETQITSDLGLDLAFAFGTLEVDYLYGDLPALSAETAGELELDDIVLNRAEIEEGTLSCRIVNELPVGAEVSFTLQEFFPAWRTTPFDTVFVMPASEFIEIHISLAGAALEVGGADHLNWSISATTVATQYPARVQLDMGVSGTFWTSYLKAGLISGVLDHREASIDPTEVTIDFPDEIEDIEFVTAEAEIIVRNAAGMSATAEMELVGYDSESGDSVLVAFPLEISPGSPETPAEHQILLNEGNSNIIELINLQPDRVNIGGRLLVGDGQTAGELRSDHYVDATFTVRTPMRLIVHDARYESEPDSLEMDEDARERIEEDLEEVAINVTAENHFPTGARLQLHFARTAAAAFVADDLVLETGLIEAAEVNPETGRVSTPMTSVFTIGIDAEDVDLFTEEIVYVGVEIVLGSTGDQPVEFWTTDYLRLSGIVELHVHVH